MFSMDVHQTDLASHFLWIELNGKGRTGIKRMRRAIGLWEKFAHPWYRILSRILPLCRVSGKDSAVSLGTIAYKRISERKTHKPYKTTSVTSHWAEKNLIVVNSYILAWYLELYQATHPCSRKRPEWTAEQTGKTSWQLAVNLEKRKSSQ